MYSLYCITIDISIKWTNKIKHERPHLPHHVRVTSQLPRFRARPAGLRNYWTWSEKKNHPAFSRKKPGSWLNLSCSTVRRTDIKINMYIVNSFFYIVLYERLILFLRVQCAMLTKVTNRRDSALIIPQTMFGFSDSRLPWMSHLSTIDFILSSFFI